MKGRKALLTAVLLCLLCGCGKEPLPQPEEIQPVGIEEAKESSFENIFAEESLTPPPEKESEPEEIAEETPQPGPEEVSITISFAGDCSLGNHHRQDYANSFRREYDLQTPAYFLENVSPVFAEDDMTLVNFEGVLTFYDKCDLGEAYNIKGDPEYVKILTEGNVECVSLANNHALDYGVTGRNDTVQALEGEGITYAYQDVIGLYETKGIKVGYIAYSSVGSALSKEVKTGVEKGLQALEEAGADIKIVCLHWGIETNHYPEGFQTTFAHDIIDMGADLIIGHHPHVLQGIEEYKGRFIVYSLGNFCFGANRNPKDKDTMIFQQTFTFIDGERQEQLNGRVIPCSISSVSERNNYQPTPQEGEEAERIIERINTFSEAYHVTFDADGYYVNSEGE